MNLTIIEIAKEMGSSPHLLPLLQNIPSPLMGEGKGGGGPCYFLKNSKGLSALFLIFAMLLMVTVGYVLTYLMPAKSKSVVFPIYSNQAFFIAQSGVEYSVRYASDQGWRGTGALLLLNNSGVNQRNLGNGRITINYADASDTLTSTGEITGASEKRIIKVTTFTQFLWLIFDPGSPGPCWFLQTRRARFYIKNVGKSSTTLNGFSAAWTANNTRTISRLDMAGSQKYSGTYTNGNSHVHFNRGGNSQTIGVNQVITVEVYWNNNLSNAHSITITFYTAADDPYAFKLDPYDGGLSAC